MQQNNNKQSLSFHQSVTSLSARELELTMLIEAQCKEGKVKKQNTSLFFWRTWVTWPGLESQIWLQRQLDLHPVLLIPDSSDVHRKYRDGRRSGLKWRVRLSPSRPEFASSLKPSVDRTQEDPTRIWAWAFTQRPETLKGRLSVPVGHAKGCFHAWTRRLLGRTSVCDNPGLQPEPGTVSIS